MDAAIPIMDAAALMPSSERACLGPQQRERTPDDEAADRLRRSLPDPYAAPAT